MRKTSQHAGKSRAEKEYYSKALKHIDYEPTVDETMKFPETDDAARDYSTPTSTHRRKTPIKQQIIDHFEENWIKWVIVGASIVIFYLMVDSKIAISTIGTKVDVIKEDVSELKKAEKDNQKRFHQQDLQIQEARLRIDAFEKQGSNQDKPLTEKN